MNITELQKKYGATYTKPTSYTSAPTIAQRVAQKYGAVEKPSMFAGTKSIFTGLKEDPLSLKAEPSKIISNAWNVVKGSVVEEGRRIKDFFNSFGRTPGPGEEVGKGLEAVAGAGHVIFSPISAIFEGANQIPVLGSISKLITVPFAAAGEVGAGLSGKAVDALPISQTTKDHIKGGVQEITALAAQLAIGRAMGLLKKSKLERKYGKKDAETIERVATELATKEIAKPKKTADVVANKYSAKVVKPLEKAEPLAQEASKYKSAEEFVEAQPKVYHGTNKKFDKFDIKMSGETTGAGDFGEGIYFTNKKSVAKSFAKDVGGDTVMEVKLDLKNPARNKDLLDTEIQLAIDDGFFGSLEGVLKKKGFDGIEFTHKSGSIEYVVYNVNKIKTKSQLTKIYTQATKGVKTTPSGLAATLKVKATEAGLDIGEIPELPTRPGMAKVADTFVKDNFLKAKKALKNQEPVNNLMPQEIYSALARKAVKESDIATLLELKDSPLGRRTGQALQALDTNIGIDPIRVAKGIENVRTKNVGKIKEIKTTSKKVVETIKKSSASKLSKFIEDLKC